MPANPIASYGAPVVITDGATQTIDATQGSIFTWTLGASRTVSTFLTPPAGAVLFLEVTQDGTGSRVLTWPSNVSWASNGTAPTLTTTAAKTDVLQFVWNVTANKWRGSVVGLNMA